MPSFSAHGQAVPDQRTAISISSLLSIDYLLFCIARYKIN
ncbi:hypothetical protein ETAE_1365 [Edwardsiella piscicida]|uniref:Uncharacterized protein n=1 Tax=Edwardsiella piscicida TaxID=1263550 RepID=A0AAU8PDF0_EDWPI|nr:hypothetical protein ETAE_1365 [Edwardsiella tarda EIB202]